MKGYTKVKYYCFKYPGKMSYLRHLSQKKGCKPEKQAGYKEEKHIFTGKTM